MQHSKCKRYTRKKRLTSDRSTGKLGGGRQGAVPFTKSNPKAGIVVNSLKSLRSKVRITHREEVIGSVAKRNSEGFAKSGVVDLLRDF